MWILLLNIICHSYIQFNRTLFFSLNTIETTPQNGSRLISKRGQTESFNMWILFLNSFSHSYIHFNRIILSPSEYG